MLAKKPRAPRAFRKPASSLTSIASLLAPTGDLRALKNKL